MRKVSVTLSIPEYVERRASFCSKVQNTSSANILVEWLARAITPDVLQDVKSGNLTIGLAAEILHVSHHELLVLAKSLEIELGPTAEQFMDALERGNDLVSRRKRKTPEKSDD